MNIQQYLKLLPLRPLGGEGRGEVGIFTFSNHINRSHPSPYPLPIKGRGILAHATDLISPIFLQPHAHAREGLNPYIYRRPEPAGAPPEPSKAGPVVAAQGHGLAS
jgi:hypothetical protein